MDNQKAICLGPGGRDKVFFCRYPQINWIGILFNVYLQCTLAATGTEQSMRLSSYTCGPPWDPGQTQRMSRMKWVLEIT